MIIVQGWCRYCGTPWKRATGPYQTKGASETCPKCGVKGWPECEEPKRVEPPKK